MADLYYLDGVEESESIANETTESGDSAVSGTGTTNTQSATSNASTNEVVKLATRVESLEKYVQDLQNNVIRKNSDATLNSLTIKDRISAWWGKVGGWLIDSGKLISSGIEIDSNNSQIKSTDYASDAQGFIIRKDLIEATNIRARGSLQGATFNYNVISAVGGQLMVANADVLAVDMTAMDANTITISGSTTFALNDILVIRGIASSGVQEEWLRIINIDNAPTYIVTRDLAGLFSTNANPTWKKGTPIVKQGNINTISGNQYNFSYLTGGNNPSALSAFDTLGQGDNDGKIKFEIDGIIYDNVAVDLQKADAAETKYIDFHYTDGEGNGSGSLAGQTFKTAANQIRITAIGINSYRNSLAPITVSLYSSIGGTLLASKSQMVSTGINKFVFDTEVVCEPGTTYFFTTGIHAYTRSDNYADGAEYSWNGSSWSEDVGYDLLFAIFGKNIDTFDTYDELAARLQTAIRAQTGKEETVTYETNHFLITSDEPEYSIKKFTTPSTGVDITGCGGTLYFDLGTNATETEGGYGDGGWLRLIGEGTNAPFYSVFKRTGIDYDDYIEACRLGNLNGFLGYNTNEFGIGIGDNNGYLKYDPTNGLRIAGNIQNTVYIEAGMNITAGEAVFIGDDGKVYSTDATVAACTSAFIGFCTTTTSQGDTAPIMITGNYSGLSSLTTGSNYYLKNATQNIDQQMTTSGIMRGAASGTKMWQSFTVGNGITNISGFSAYLSLIGGCNGSVYLYSGEGVGGTLLGSGSYTGDNTSGWKDFYFDAYISLTAGQQYTIAVDVGGTSQTTWGNYETSNSYSGGRSDRNAAHDRMFKTYYTTARGAINTSAGTTSKKIGLALSTTEVLILNT